MARFEITLVILALTCYFDNSLAITQSSFSRNWSLGESSSKALQPGTLFIADEQTFPSAVCEVTVPKKEKQCNVTVTVQNKADHVCQNIKIFASEGRELFLDGFYQLIPFNRDHIVVAWYDNTGESGNSDEREQNFNFDILNTDTCKSSHLSFPIDKVAYGFFPALVFYQNQIDVVVNSKATCHGADKCKLTYDLEGKQIGDVQPYKPALSQYASPVSAAEPKKGFFMQSKDLTSLTVLKVENSGDSKELLAVNFEQSSTEPLVVFSNAHELYTICRQTVTSSGSPSTVYCSQFNESGETRINTSVELDNSAAWIVVRNLREGGFLLGTSSCSEPKTQQNDSRNFNVFQIQDNGQVAKKVEVQGPDFQCQNKESGLEVRLTENDRHEYCFDFSYLPSSTNLRFSRFCRSEY